MNVNQINLCKIILAICIFSFVLFTKDNLQSRVLRINSTNKKYIQDRYISKYSHNVKTS